MKSKYLRLRIGQRLREGDEWKNGSGRWVPVKNYNWGAAISEDYPIQKFRRMPPWR